jgi:hypothetical protein
MIWSTVFKWPFSDDPARLASFKCSNLRIRLKVRGSLLRWSPTTSQVVEAFGGAVRSHPAFRAPTLYDAEGSDAP